MISSKQSALVLIFLVTVTFFGCRPDKGQNSARVPKGNIKLGGSLAVAEFQLPESLVPSAINDAISTRIGTSLHCGLLRLDDKTLKVVPGIAESWSVDDSGTSYVFQLRKGAFFHPSKCFKNASREIVASDVKFTFEELCKPDGGPAFESTFSGRVKGADAFHSGEAATISGVEVIDDYTIKIELIKPDPSFLFVLAQASTGVIPEEIQNHCDENGSVGAGPFRLVKKNGVIQMVRFEDYFQTDAFGNRLPYIDTLVVRPIPSKEKQLNAFFAGDIDLVTNLYLDPVRNILEEHISEFAGKDPQYVLRREGETAGEETYTIHRSELIGFEENFMTYRDFSKVQMKQR